MTARTAKKLTLSAGILKLISGHSEVVATLLRDACQAESPEALEKAGVSAQDCQLALSNALTDGHTEVAAELAGELNFGSLAQVQACIQAYTDYAAREPWNGWDPSYASIYTWPELVNSKPEVVLLWMDSGALKIPAEEFWEVIGNNASHFESEVCAAGLSAYCARSEARQQSPRPSTVAALGPIAMQACVEGFCSAHSWSSLREMVNVLSESTFDLPIQEPARTHGLQHVQALALTLAQTAAPWVHVPSYYDNPLHLACGLSDLSQEAGVVFAQSASHVLIDLNTLRGRLSQPSDGDDEAYAVNWTSSGSKHGSRAEQVQLPPLLFPLSDIAAQWISPRGRAVAQAAGFTSSPRATQIFEALVELKDSDSPSKRLALTEQIVLIAQTPTLPLPLMRPPRL